MTATDAALRRLVAAALLAACALVQPATARTAQETAAPAAERVALAVAEASAKRKRGQRVWCVPFARTLSGIDLQGNARTWWAAAEGRYARGHTPVPGAVMVFAGSRAMPKGHLAVVAAVVSEREILIDHANWHRNQVSLGMKAIDVSEKGDWSAVRVEGTPRVPGRVNPVSGFIYPGEMVASN